MSDRDPIEELRGFAEALADAAGETVMPHFRQDPAVADKGDGTERFDPVTEADRGAEKVMREIIADRYPDHGIYGEEFGIEASDADYVWYLDPIDGTRSFITGIPLWGILIGLAERGKPLVGLMEQPFIGERFVGMPGKTEYRRGNGIWSALSTSGCARLEEARLASTDPALFTSIGRDDLLDDLRARTRMLRFGGDCYLYAMLAAGHYDLVVEPSLNPYDIAGLIPIVENAGGVVTTWDGGSAAGGGHVVAAANPRLHELALEVIAG